MKLSYFELLSPEPVYLENVGGICSPKLKDIASIGIKKYQYYLSLLLMEQELFDALSTNFELAIVLQQALDFFFQEDIVFSKEKNCFIVQKNENTIGLVTKDSYPIICDLIFQRNSMKSNQTEDLSKIKNKKALEIMEKLQKGRAEKAKHTKVDKNMELGNIISAVANKSPSLNMINIWNLTVFQLWDCFSRICNNNAYTLQSMSVAIYGNKDKAFDINSWFRRIDENT